MLVIDDAFVTLIAPREGLVVMTAADFLAASQGAEQDRTPRRRRA